ncbi:hypothetical protein CH063_14593 [Colletotrichum higginsianum]|uniref:Uncharacterized protein n=1 Tax=Colletotrichum higginsianum (strain IMI 349063) TaxID=759273 RepID=H1VZ83_COLHI|nr:hypothetical protein CH063_14593 [Colletotrichum higginsianum]
MYMHLYLYRPIYISIQNPVLPSSVSSKAQAQPAFYTTTSFPTSSNALTSPSTVPLRVWQLTTTRKKLPCSPGA